MYRTLMIAGAAVVALAATSADAATHHRHHHPMHRHLARAEPVYHHRAAPAAAGYGEEAAAVSREDALNPNGGPTVISSRPVPDTRGNRERFGAPMSRSGQLTPPIGD